MTRAQARRWLEARYNEQAIKFPTLRSVARETYVRANIRHVMRHVMRKRP